MPKKKLPNEVKVLRGTDQPCRMAKNVPMVTIEIPLVPEWLSDRAKEAYMELSSTLLDMKVLSRGDRTALSLLCEAYADYREAREFLKEHGNTYTTGQVKTIEYTESEGKVEKLVENSIMFRAYPQVAMKNAAWTQVRSMLSEFGLTPSSRTKVSPIGKEDKDPLQDLLDRMG